VHRFDVVLFKLTPDRPAKRQWPSNWQPAKLPADRLGNQPKVPAGKRLERANPSAKQGQPVWVV